MGLNFAPYFGNLQRHVPGDEYLGNGRTRPLPDRFLLVTLLIKDILTYELGNTVEHPITGLCRQDP